MSGSTFGTYAADAVGHVWVSGSETAGVSNVKLNAPIVAITSQLFGTAPVFWLAGGDGGVFSVGGAPFYGSTGNIRLNKPVVGIAPTPDGQGYWLVAADGGVFSFGDAGFYGSTGNVRLNQPVVGMASTSDGRGYWLVAADGGVFTFGDAQFFGSLANYRLNGPIVAISVPFGDLYDGSNLLTGAGYWLAGKDGGVFTFGKLPFRGSFVGSDASPVIAFGWDYFQSEAPPYHQVFDGYSILKASGQMYGL